MADKIRKEDIIDTGLFDDAIKGANEWIATAKEVEKQQIATLESSKNLFIAFKADGSKSLIENEKLQQQVNKTLREHELLQKELVKTEQAKQVLEREILKTSQAKLKADQDAVKVQEKQNKALKDANSEYKQASTELLNLKKQLKDLSVAGKQNTAEFDALNTKFQELDKVVRSADESVGDFQRNVGNYPKQLKEMQKALQGLEPGTEEFNKLAAKAGELKDKIQDAKDATKAFATESKASTAKTLFSQIGNDIADLDFKGAAEKAAQFGSVIRSIKVDEVIDGLKDLGSAIFDLGKALLLNPLTFIIAGAAAGAAVVYDYVKAFQRFGEVTEDVNKQLEKTTSFIDDLSKKQQEYILRIRLAYSSLTDAQKKQKQDELKNTQERKAVLKEFSDEVKKLELTRLENIRGLASFDKARQKQEEITFNENLFQLKVTFAKRLIKLRATQALEEKAQEAEIAAQKRKDLIKANEDLNNQLIALRIETTNLDQRQEEDRAKNEFRLAKKAVQDSKGSSEIKNKIIAELEIKLQQQLLDIKNKYADEQRKKEEKEVEELAKKEAEIDKKVIESGQKTADANAKLAEEQTKKIQDELNKRAAIRQKEYEEAIKMSEQVLAIVEKELNKKSELRQKGLDDDIKKTDENIEKQKELASKGLANTLAFEEEKKAKLELQKEEEKKKEEKRQEVLAFLRLLAGYAEKDPDGALQKALRDTLLAKSIAGAFFTGTEKVEDDLKGNKVHSGRDGYHIAVDGSERIMTGEQNKLIGNMSNEDLAKLANDYNTGRLMQFGAIPENDFSQNIADSILIHQLAAQNKLLQEVKQAIADKPVSHFEFNKFGDFIETSIQNGMTKVITHKNKRRI